MTPPRPALLTTVVALLATLLLTMLQPPAYAGSGDLARSFGKGGHRGLGGAYEGELVRVSDGRIVTFTADESSLEVRMYTAAGNRVKSFGKRGTRTLPVVGSAGRLAITWMPKRDLIILNAHTYDTGNEYARLWALKLDGSLAKGFGNGGTVTHGPGFWNDVQAQGKKILVVGQNQVARLNPDGLTFDSSFNGGAGSITFGDPELLLQQLTLHRRGFFVSGASREGLEVFKLTRGGALATGWGAGGNSTWAAPAPSGYTAVGYAAGLMDVRDRKGRIVYVGTVRATYPGTTGEYQIPVTGALRANGYLDEKFTNGRPGEYQFRGAPVALRKGRTLVPGSGFGKSGGYASVTRLTSRGRPDQAFGRGGNFHVPHRDAFDVKAVLPPYHGTMVGLAFGYTDSGSFMELVGIQG